MTLLEDSRQQKGKHKNIELYCKQAGIRLVRTKLLVGDYMLAGGAENGLVTSGIKGDIACDSKMGLPEVASNCFQEHERFRAECQLAKDLGIKLIILIEEVPPGGEVRNWVSPLDRYGKAKYKFNPETLQKVMETMTDRYDVQFRFCDGRSTGKHLIEYLKGERK